MTAMKNRDATNDEEDADVRLVYWLLAEITPEDWEDVQIMAFRPVAKLRRPNAMTPNAMLNSNAYSNTGRHVRDHHSHHRFRLRQPVCGGDEGGHAVDPSGGADGRYFASHRPAERAARGDRAGRGDHLVPRGDDPRRRGRSGRRYGAADRVRPNRRSAVSRSRQRPAEPVDGEDAPVADHRAGESRALAAVGFPDVSRPRHHGARRVQLSLGMEADRLGPGGSRSWSNWIGRPRASRRAKSAAASCGSTALGM